MKVTTIWGVDQKTHLELPLFSTRITAGYPSPGADYIESNLDLNELLIKHPKATFYVQVEGDSMKDVGIINGDILVVDRALEAEHNDIVVAILDGELVVKRLRITDAKRVSLVAENPAYTSIEITKVMRFEIWGVVTWAIHRLKFRRFP